MTSTTRLLVALTGLVLAPSLAWATSDGMRHAHCDHIQSGKAAIALEDCHAALLARL